MDYIGELLQAIRKLHGVKASHLGSVPVKEEFEGQTVWEGAVEVFELIGHPETKLAYAWTHETDDGKKRSVAVLHVPPVDSPLAAVRASIVKDVRDVAKSKKDR